MTKTNLFVIANVKQLRT